MTSSSGAKTTAAAKDAKAEEEEGLSKQAQFSTYSEASLPAGVEPRNPPDGPGVEQTRGKPSEGATTKQFPYR